MRKKIIYLLSLLMALSLVFASCKKNGAGDITGGNINGNPPDEGDNTENTDPNTGLMNQWSDIPTEGYIKKVTVFSPTDTDFFRNPVVVVLGTKKNKVIVFTEKRYAVNGGGNDVGITGELVVDIAYTVSGNSGNSFNYNGFVNPGEAATAPGDVKNSHGAPIVFKVGDNKVVVVASAGAGIGRVAQPYSARKKDMPSRIDYIIGDFNEGTGKFTWGNWATILEGDTSSGQLGFEVAQIDTGNTSLKFEQFATHTAKGYYNDSDKKLYVPVVMANQGTSSSPNELMGVLMVVGSWSDSNVTSWEIKGYRAFAKVNNQFSKLKESRVLGKTSSGDIKYLTVPNPSYGTSVAEGSISPTTQSAGNEPTDLTLAGNEGSPGYIDFADKWYGTAEYTIDSSSGTISGHGNTPNRGLYMHVKQQFKNVTLYLVDTANNIAKVSGSKEKHINDQGKSSSIDMLGDGTIVMAAEEGAKSGQKDFYISFTRYGQGALAKEFGVEK